MYVPAVTDSPLTLPATSSTPAALPSHTLQAAPYRQVRCTCIFPFSACLTLDSEISLLGATLTTLRISGSPGLNAGLIGGIPSQLSFLSGLKTLSFGNNRYALYCQTKCTY